MREAVVAKRQWKIRCFLAMTAMVKPLSYRVGGSPTAFSQRKNIMSKYGDWTRGEDEALLNILGGVEVARQILRGAVKVVTEVVNFIVCTFMILVDETLSVEEAVEAGNFGWSDENIVSKNFPKPANGKKSEKEVVLFHFNKSMSSEAAIAEMDKVGYRPATIWELLGLAVKEPDLQRKFPIIALGSVCELCGIRHVAFLYEEPDFRGLGLDRFGGGWGDGGRFAGVRK